MNFRKFNFFVFLVFLLIFPIPLNIFSKSLILIFKVQLLSSFFLTLKFISHFPSTIYHHNSPNQSSIYFYSNRKQINKSV
jgi:hypothetical protein